MRSRPSVESKDGREQRRKLTFAAIMPRSLRLQNGAESARCGTADSGFVLRGRFAAPQDEVRAFASALVLRRAEGASRRTRERPGRCAESPRTLASRTPSSPYRWLVAVGSPHPPLCATFSQWEEGADEGGGHAWFGDKRGSFTQNAGLDASRAMAAPTCFSVSSRCRETAAIRLREPTKRAY
jgi:hypothetical protein